MKIFNRMLTMLFFWSIQTQLQGQEPVLMMIKFKSDVPWREIDSLRKAYQGTQLDSTVTTNVRLWSIPTQIQTKYSGLSGILNDIETSYNAHGNVGASSTKAATDSLATIAVNAVSPGVRTCFNPTFSSMCISNPNHPSKIAVIDTGIDSAVAVQNPDLSLFFNKKLSRNFSSLRNAPADLLDIRDRVGHGTSMCHIIAQIWAKNGLLGKSIGQEIIMLRIFDENNHASQWSLVKALDFVLQEQIPVVNMSLNWQTKKHNNVYNTTILQQIFEQLKRNSTLVIASAGNDGKNIDRDWSTDSIAYMPGNMGYNGNTNTVPSSLYTVAATACNDSVARFSNWGLSSVPAAVLGWNVLALDHTNVLKYSSGTSVSAAIIAGLVGAKGAHHPTRMNNTQLRDLLRFDCGKDKPQLNGMVQFGITLLSDQAEGNLIPTELKIFPNPVTDLLQIRFHLNSKKEVQIVLQDVFGRVIQLQKWEANGGENALAWRISPTLASGLYVLTLKTNHFFITQKIQVR
jgi:Subtilase family/Secretion system C-terminal sorting domain